jgi:RNA polymerase sigma factor (sigma-70 family)
MYLAIDEMRRDGLVRRPDSQQAPAESIKGELPDPDGEDSLRDLVNRDTAEALLAALPQDDRDLLMMYYGQGMTLREIGQVRGVTEAAVCVRHQQLIAKLRRCAKRFGLLTGAGQDGGRHRDA